MSWFTELVLKYFWRKWWFTVVGCGEICRILMSWFTELVLKYFWRCLGFYFMHKDKAI